MSETPESPTPPSSPDPAPQSDAVVISQEEVEAGKVFAILSYVVSFIGLPFFLVPMIMRDNEFSLYHSKQVLMIWLFSLAGSVIGAPLMLICVGALVLLAVGVISLVLLVIGLINAINGQAKPLPIIGKLGEQWFGGLKTVAK